MQRWKQYGGLSGLAVGCLVTGWWGFRATGGALPWAKRSAKTLQRGVQQGGGSLIDLGRGIVIAGPIRKGGLLAEFAGAVMLLVLVAIGLYLYADRYRSTTDADRSAS
jgi:hypothetical protein